MGGIEASYVCVRGIVGYGKRERGGDENLRKRKVVTRGEGDEHLGGGLHGKRYMSFDSEERC